MSNTIKPTLSVPIFHGEVTVHGFGAEHGCDFSFRGIDESRDAYESHRNIFEALASIPAACDYFAPSPVYMNAELTRPDEMMNGNMWLYRLSNAPCKPFYLRRGGYADGLINISSSNGYAMSSADCALIVAKCDNLIIAAHAGRNSLIDIGRWKGNAPRKHESVVENICNWRAAEHGCLRRNIQVWVGFSISPGPHFEHVITPAHPYGRELIRYVSHTYGHECFADDGGNGERGWLDLKELIRRQFMLYGVPEENITLDRVCTNTDMKDDKPLWYSNARKEKNRNLIAVVKNL